MAAKPVSMFDPKLIELQKKYAKDLLTHYNPYTKLRYCDDPAVALVEITNENSLIKMAAWDFSPYYKKQLDEKWDAWRKNKKDNSSKKDFYLYLESDFFKQMKEFLKNECDVKAPITGIGGYRTYEDIQAQSSMDFIDYHSYWDHPKFPRKRWDRNDFYIHNKSLLNDKGLGIITDFLKSDPKRNNPFTITEWNHCFPNKYAYETPTLLAAYAVKHNWDALFQFAYADGWKGTPVFNKIINYFDSIANAQQLILGSIGSLIYQKVDNFEIDCQKEACKISSENLNGIFGKIKDKTWILDSFSFKPRENGVIFLYSKAAKSEKNPKNQKHYVLIAVSEIKNSKIKNGKSYRPYPDNYIWGQAPTLLKRMDFDIKFLDARNAEFYSLDSHGKRKRLTFLESATNTPTLSLKNRRSPIFEIVTY